MWGSDSLYTLAEFPPTPTMIRYAWLEKNMDFADTKAYLHKRKIYIQNRGNISFMAIFLFSTLKGLILLFPWMLEPNVPTYRHILRPAFPCKRTRIYINIHDYPPNSRTHNTAGTTRTSSHMEYGGWR